MQRVDALGAATPPVAVTVDLAAAKAFAAVLGASEECDVHPWYPVAVEWTAPLSWPASWVEAWAEHGGRAVHAWHDLRLHRELAAGHVTMRAEVAGQRNLSAGAMTAVRYDATDDSGPLWSTRAGVLWRGATTRDGGACDPPDLRAVGTANTFTIDIPADFAHTYSAASSIWNPIHTDDATARRAGLDAPILHGSATFGLAATRVAEAAGQQLSDVRRLAVRFTAPVTPPTRLEVRWQRDRATTAFHVLTPDGTVALTGLTRTDHGESA